MNSQPPPPYSDIYPNNSSKDKILVAIDFGTTYSGVAYCFAYGNKPDVVTIKSWPGLEGCSQPKVPTIISYDPQNPSNFTWGGQTHTGITIQGIKLLLDPDQDEPVYAPSNNGEAQLRRVGKTAVDVAADFIRAIYQHAWSTLESNVPRAYLADCTLKFVATVPAVWTDKAKDATLKAVKQAGLDPVTLVTEPEAASLYTLHALQNCSLQVGDAFVICDAGGGTVDLISYEIKKLAPRLELGELVEGTGALAGSILLNRRFEQAVLELVGEDQFHSLKVNKLAWGPAVQHFDRYTKKAYRGDDDEKYFLSFPTAALQDDVDKGLTSNMWAIRGSDLRKIFSPVINTILMLNEGQVDKIKLKRFSEQSRRDSPIKAIFLVGGFGESHYLKDCLAKKFSDIQVIQPVDAWSAVLQGAILSVLPNEAIVKTSVAKLSWGVNALSKYDALRDMGQPRQWSADRGYDEVAKMAWYVKKGDELERERRIAFSFYRTVQEHCPRSHLLFVDSLLMCNSTTPPRYPIDGVTKTWCNVSADLRSVDTSLFTRRVGADGNKYWDVHFKLTLTTVSAGFRFALEFNGQEMGGVNAQFE